jgi:hypothetical protein
MLPIYFALLTFLWDYEAKPTTFLLTLESIEAITGVQQVRIAGVVPKDCAKLPSATAITFCTTITCPGMGQFRATVETEGRQSNTITFRVRDKACTQVDGPEVLHGGPPVAGIPPAAPCRSKVALSPPPVVTMETPTMTEIPRTVAVPLTQAPVIPRNPKVIAKVPHDAPPLKLPDPARVPIPPREVTDPPPARTVAVPAGPPQTTQVPLPAVEPPRAPCP